MPKRPDAHVIADRAVAAVVRLFAEAGHAIERIANDYGEDLLVQSAHAGRMDASRLWLQVKGTTTIERYRAKSGDFRYGFPLDHVLRWVRSADSVLVVLWDVVGDRGWYADPMQVDEFAVAGRQRVTLRFRADDVLDAPAVERLVWDARLELYRTLVLRAMDIDAALEDDPTHVSTVPLLALDVLGLFRLIETSPRGKVRVAPTARRRYIQALERHMIAEPTENVEKLYDQCVGTAVLVVLAAAREAGADGLPFALVRACADVFLGLVGAYDALATVEDVP